MGDFVPNVARKDPPDPVVGPYCHSFHWTQRLKVGEQKNRSAFWADFVKCKRLRVYGSANRGPAFANQIRRLNRKRDP
jgi:hypothetical protein